MNAREPWMADGICLTVDAELWFPHTGQSSATAKQMCRVCPVQIECLTFALERDEAGVWGGLTRRERQRLRTRTGRDIRKRGAA